MKPLSGALFFLGLTSAIAIACGGEAAPEAKSPEAPVADPPPASTAAASTPPAASSPPSTVSPPTPAESAAPVASADPPKSKDGLPTETKDECTPVGVDFEKRARPKLKDCYAEGKKKDKNLEGTVKIKITVDMKGKIKSTKVLEKTLPDPVANCMLKAVQATPFPEVDKCWDSTLTIPITFPTPR